MPSTYEPIATTTLGTAASSMTFSSIPSTYTDLRLVTVFRNTTSAADSWISFNGVTTGNLYSFQRLKGDGSTASAQQSVTNSYPVTPDGQALSPNWSMTTLDLFSYAGSTNKSCLINTSIDLNGSGSTMLWAGLFSSTSAITSLSVYTLTANFAIGSTATLYGIKNA
jgi:hypothetical protein